MNIKCLPLSCNCYIVSDESGNTILFDPCERGEELYVYVKEQGLCLSAVIITHAHFDHIYGLTDLLEFAEKDGKSIPVYVHKGDAPEDLQILTLNVNGDSRINTFDAIGIMEAFVDGSDYGVVTKAATITTQQ